MTADTIRHLPSLCHGIITETQTIIAARTYQSIRRDKERRTRSHKAIDSNQFEPVLYGWAELIMLHGPRDGSQSKDPAQFRVSTILLKMLYLVARLNVY